MIKGFTTLKFGVGCALAYFVLYCIYSLIQIWDEEDLELKKIIAILFALIAIAIMKILESHIAIKHFIMGAGRYNQVRHVNECMPTRLPSQSKQNISQNEDKQKKGVKPKVTYNLQKIKRYFSLGPADLLKFSINEQDMINARNAKMAHRSFSTSMFNPQDSLNLGALQRKKRNEQFQKLTDDYKKYLKNNKKVEQIEEMKLKKAKNIIGNIFKNQISKHLTNIKNIIQKVQNMFDIHVVQFKTNQSSNYASRPTSNRQQIGRIHLRDDRQIQLDEILNNYNRGLLWKCGYKLKRSALDDLQYRARLADQIQLAIRDRKVLDQKINYKSAFANHRERINVINKLTNISQNMLSNKQILGREHNITQDFQLRYTIIWLLSKYINELVKNKLMQATVYMEENTQNQNKQSYIRWLPRNTEMLVHFNIFVDKMVETSESREEIVCKPGEDNILSVFVNYLDYIGRNYKRWLGSVPELSQYINYQFYYDTQAVSTK